MELQSFLIPKAQRRCTPKKRNPSWPLNRPPKLHQIFRSSATGGSGTGGSATGGSVRTASCRAVQNTHLMFITKSMFAQALEDSEESKKKPPKEEAGHVTRALLSCSCACACASSFPLLPAASRCSSAPRPFLQAEQLDAAAQRLAHRLAVGRAGTGTGSGTGSCAGACPSATACTCARSVWFRQQQCRRGLRL